MSEITVTRVCPLCRREHGREITCKEVKRQAREMTEAARAIAHSPTQALAMSFAGMRLRAMMRQRADRLREQRERGE